jgi:hypothetical protein
MDPNIASSERKIS